MALVIKNGEIVTPTSRYHGDIWCEGETITEIGTHLNPPPSAEVIDAKGKLIFPGFIDPHVHIYLPFMGTYAKDTYETASRAALVGGTTTLVEMVCPARGDDPWESYELWKSQAAGRSACDYTFHMGVTRWDEHSEDVLRRVVDDGTASFMFLASRMGLDPSVAQAMHDGPSYIPTVREAFDRLVAWVEHGQAPPPSQTVEPGQPLQK